MEPSLEKISQEALSLPTKSRAALAEKLLDSLDADEETSEEHELIWAQEAERRYAEIVEGKTVTKPAEAVMNAARERFKN